MTCRLAPDAGLWRTGSWIEMVGELSVEQGAGEVWSSTRSANQEPRNLTPSHVGGQN